MSEIVQVEEDAFPEIADDLGGITEEILSYMENIEKSIFEIGKRLKFVKENVPSAAFKKWVEDSFGFHPSTVSRFIAAYEQFGNIATSQKLGTGKIFEMVALPESIDRREFVEGVYVIPSTGETKTIEQMTVKELREVVKPLKEGEKRLKQTATERVNKDVAKFPSGQVEQVELPKDAPMEPVAGEVSTEDIPIIDVENRAENKTELITSIMKFTKDVRELAEKYQFLSEYLNDIKSLDSAVRKEFNDAAYLLSNFATDILLPVNNGPMLNNEHFNVIGPS